MEDQRASEQDSPPRHVTELRAIEWELSDIIKRLEAMSKQVHELAEMGMRERGEGPSSEAI